MDTENFVHQWATTKELDHNDETCFSSYGFNAKHYPYTRRVSLLLWNVHMHFAVINGQFLFKD